jgi:hypothetical protein
LLVERFIEELDFPPALAPRFFLPTELPLDRDDDPPDRDEVEEPDRDDPRPPRPPPNAPARRETVSGFFRTCPTALLMASPAIETSSEPASFIFDPALRRVFLSLRAVGLFIIELERLEPDLPDDDFPDDRPELRFVDFVVDLVVDFFFAMALLAVNRSLEWTGRAVASETVPVRPSVNF